MARALGCSTGRSRLHASLRSGRRSRATRPRGAQHRARGAAHRRADVSRRSRHLDPELRARAVSADLGCLPAAGLDLARDRIPVGPAAHYIMGGVQTDLDGQTTIGGLFAAGEVACTGVHGANRLASNSLLEGLVFGASAGRAMRADLRRGAYPVDAEPNRFLRPASRMRSDVDAHAGPRFKRRMWRDVGLFRDRISLASSLGALGAAWRSLDGWLRDGGPLDASRLARREHVHRRPAHRACGARGARRAAAGTTATISRHATIYTGIAGSPIGFRL